MRSYRVALMALVLVLVFAGLVLGLVYFIVRRSDSYYQALTQQLSTKLYLEIEQYQQKELLFEMPEEVAQTSNHNGCLAEGQLPIVSVSALDARYQPFTTGNYEFSFTLTFQEQQCMGRIYIFLQRDQLISIAYFRIFSDETSSDGYRSERSNHPIVVYLESRINEGLLTPVFD